MRKKALSILIYLITIGWMIIIFVFSRQNGAESSSLSAKFVELPKRIFYPDFDTYSKVEQTAIIRRLSMFIRKGAHMSEYAILCLFMFLSVRTITQRFEPYLIAPAFCLLYAISDEVHQGFVSGRNMAFTDVLIDFSGALLMLLLIGFVEILLKRRNKVKKDV